MVGFPINEIFDCGCDLTFAFPKSLHNPEGNIWMIAHEAYPMSLKVAEKMKNAIFTPEGGI